jgi:putative transposase
VETRRSLVISLTRTLPPTIRHLLAEFRLLVNEGLREALVKGRTSRGSLSRFALDRAAAARVNGQYGIQACELALSLAKGHRRRLRRGRHSRVPYVRAPFLRTSARCFHINPVSGKVRLSLRAGEWASFEAAFSNYARERLSEPGVRLTQLQLTPALLVLVLAKESPELYEPTSLYALDTNESSLDGIRLRHCPSLGTTPTPPRESRTRSTPPRAAAYSEARLGRIRFPEIRSIQSRYFAVRRKLARKKAHDRRVARRLLRLQGWRVRHRVHSRLHFLSLRLVERAARERAAIALEDLTGMPVRRGVSSRTRRRLSSWPRRELHRQIAYKAEDRGVPIYWVNPRRTSTTCPRCGEVTKQHRSRVGPKFRCAKCSWSMDRQLNAGVNIGQTVLREHRAELGGLRLDPDAVLNDARRPLYLLGRTRRAMGQRRGREG